MVYLKLLKLLRRQTMSNETKRMDYSFIDEDSSSERSIIQINEGEYEGLKFTFGGIKFVAIEGDEENMGLNFTYDITENPNDVESSPEMINVLGDILVHVLESELKEVNEEFLRED